MAGFALLVAGVLSSCLIGGFKPRSPDPVIWTDKSEHNFGKIPDTQPVTHTFAVRNLGGQPLNLSNVQTSCGCTAAVLDHQILQPGETTRLNVQYDPRGRSGPQSRTVVIQSNDPKTPQKQLTVVAMIEPNNNPNGAYPTVRQEPPSPANTPSPSSTLSR